MDEVYKYVGVILEIDWQTRIVVDAEFTFITNLATDAEVEMLLQQIDTSYYAPSVHSIGVAFKSAFRVYEERVK